MIYQLSCTVELYLSIPLIPNEKVWSPNPFFLAFIKSEYLILLRQTSFIKESKVSPTIKVFALIEANKKIKLINGY